MTADVKGGWININNSWAKISEIYGISAIDKEMVIMKNEKTNVESKRLQFIFSVYYGNTKTDVYNSDESHLDIFRSSILGKIVF